MNELHAEHAASPNRAARIATQVRIVSFYTLAAGSIGYLTYAAGTSMEIVTTMLYTTAPLFMVLVIHSFASRFDGSPDPFAEDDSEFMPHWSLVAGYLVGLAFAVFDPDFILWDVIAYVRADLGI